VVNRITSKTNEVLGGIWSYNTDVCSKARASWIIQIKWVKSISRWKILCLFSVLNKKPILMDLIDPIYKNGYSNHLAVLHGRHMTKRYNSVKTFPTMCTVLSAFINIYKRLISTISGLVILWPVGFIVQTVLLADDTLR